MGERLKQLSAPKPIPGDEWTKAEKERGATFPEHIAPLRARIKTPEQHETHELLNGEVARLCNEFFERWPEPWNLSREDHNEILRRFETELLNVATLSRGLADSYRRFNVGGVLIGYQDPRVQGPNDVKPRYPSDKRTNPWRILFDANTRPETDEGVVRTQRGAKEKGRTSAVRKHCAELYLSDRIDPSKPEMGLPEEKLTKAIGMFIVGEAQTDNDSKITQITLTSCKLCRDRLWKLTQSQNESGSEREPVYSQDMPVVSADARHLNLTKWQPINRLHTFHGELPPGHQEIDGNGNGIGH